MSEPRTITNPGSAQVIRVLSETPELLVMESDYPAGCPSPPPHLHPSQDERFEVLSGAVHAVVDGRSLTLEAGDTLDVPRGTVHEFGGDPERAGTVRWEVRPALRTAEFLATVNRWSDRQTGRPSTLQAVLTAKEFAPEFRLASPSLGTQRILFALLAPIARARGLTPR
jgi:quercetin dioxygenase-like cupin family protein